MILIVCIPRGKWCWNCKQSKGTRIKIVSHQNSCISGEKSCGDILFSRAKVLCSLGNCKSIQITGNYGRSNQMLPFFSCRVTETTSTQDSQVLKSSLSDLFYFWTFHRVITTTGVARIATSRCWTTCLVPAILYVEENVASLTVYLTFGIFSKALTRQREDANWLLKCTTRLYGRLVAHILKKGTTLIALAHARINTEVPSKVSIEQP